MPDGIKRFNFTNKIWYHMITSSILINEPAAKFWKTLTDEIQMKEWYFDIPDFEL